jgi:2-polyprenyl-6-hydroxyphenyl methylase/3-demethylubiquinone-9 3-methyltransferase
MFAPDQQRVANELLRVCKPGGTIGMLNFTPEGLAADLFDVLAPWAPPPPPRAPSPLFWGSEGHVRQLFGDRALLEMRRARYVEEAQSPEEYYRLFRKTFGPVVAVHASLRDRPESAAELDRAFLGFATRANRGPRRGPARYEYEYLLVIARKHAR